MMRQGRLTLLLLEPSLISVVLCVGLGIALLVTQSWAFIVNSALPQEFVFGEYGLADSVQSLPNTSYELWQQVIGRSFVRDVISFLFIFTMGAIIYTLLQGSNKVVNGALGEWIEIHDANASFKKQIRSQVLHRLEFRFVILVTWFVYTLVFVKLIVPFCVSSARFGVVTITQFSGWQYLALGIGTLAVALYLHVVFMRLMALRPRLFGDDAVLLEKGH